MSPQDRSKGEFLRPEAEGFTAHPQDRSKGEFLRPEAEGFTVRRDAFDDWMRAELEVVEAALERFVPAETPGDLGVAMRYGVLDGGKRLRPLLVLAACEAVNSGAADGGARRAMLREAALRAACAVELIHAYSLVHDDMPCMDNDVLRRGKPTVHVRFGEAQAMLAGDAMQALAFEVLTPDEAVVAPTLQAQLVRLLARAAGHDGMAGGQAIDLASVGLPMGEAGLQDMHRRKTGALLQASVLMGASCGEPGGTARQALASYGAAIGLAFQVVDDILDVTQGSEVLGKTAGKDADANKPTYVSVLGLDGARQRAHALVAEARTALASSGLADVAWLGLLAERVIHRDC